MHSVLAVSGFHLHFQHSRHVATVETSVGGLSQGASARVEERKYLMAAHAHYSLALSLFRKAVGNPTPENTTPLFACSTLVVLASLACPRSFPRNSFFINGQDMLGVGSEDGNAFEWMRLVRGVRYVLQPSSDSIQGGYLREQTMANFTMWHADIPLEPEIETQVSRLSQLILEDADSAVRDSCQDAVEHLKKSFAWMQEEREGACLVTLGLIWPAVVENEFFRLLNAGHPLALVVMAYYCVVMEKLSGLWWASGWPVILLRTVERKLEGRWTEWLAWPMQVLGIEAYRG